MNKQTIIPVLIIFIAIVGGAILLKTPDQTAVTTEQIQVQAHEVDLRKLDLSIKNMFCIGCRSSVVNSVMAYDGVIQADANPDTDSGWVIYDSALITKEEIVRLAIFDAYPASIISDEAYSGPTETVAGEQILEEIEEKLNTLAGMLYTQNITMESFFQEELDAAIEGGYLDKANNLLDNYIAAYEQD